MKIPRPRRRTPLYGRLGGPQTNRARQYRRHPKHAHTHDEER